MFGRTRPRALYALCAALAAASTLAAAPGTIPVDLTVEGTAHLARYGTTLTLGPGSLQGEFTVDGTKVGISANLTIPPAYAEVVVVPDLLSVSATVRIVADGPVTGTLENRELRTHTNAHLELGEVAVHFGRSTIPLLPQTCRSRLSLDLNAHDVDPLSARIVQSGEFEIPPPGECWLLGPLLEALVAGPGNGLSLTLSTIAH